MECPFEISAQQLPDLIIRITAADQSIRERINAARIIQARRVIRRMRIEIEIAPEADVIDARDLHRVIEMIGHVFDRDRRSPHKLAYGRNPQPPFRAAARRTASVLHRATPGAIAQQFECVISTGFVDRERLRNSRR